MIPSNIWLWETCFWYGPEPWYCWGILVSQLLYSLCSRVTELRVHISTEAHEQSSSAAGWRVCSTCSVSAVRVKDILPHLFWFWPRLVCANINIGFSLSQPASSYGKRPHAWIMWQAFLLVGLENATFLELDPELARVTAAIQFLDVAEEAATSFH